MVGSTILQMRLEISKKEIDFVGGLRNFENAFVTLFIRERESQRQFFRDEINCCQTHGELLQKSAQHEQKRLGCFDFALKFKALFERLWRPNQFEHSIGLPVRALPHSD